MAMHFFAEIGPRLIVGLLHSLLLSAVGFLLAILIGIGCGTLRYGRLPGAHFLIACYVNIFRCTPLLVQIFMIFFALPEIGLRLSPFSTGVVALGLWGGAYLTEDIRAGLDAVSTKDILAARALGMGAVTTFMEITLPLGLRYALPAATTTALNLFRSSSLMIVVSYSELTYTANRIASDTFDIFGVFGVAALLYLISSILLSYFARGLERATYVPGFGRAV
ncbi:amino acid ABC transporter permease [Burkholderia sp. L27(2015)]|uniref:amino acid ABC transporter permease n=1 Tax=Burkholderia sp. L27(2015) TaxID=1641858 RepID=UPI0015763D52|nr:amino acid ABC transporter permease [Burkholderia sp. L27(2015)]